MHLLLGATVRGLNGFSKRIKGNLHGWHRRDLYFLHRSAISSIRCVIVVSGRRYATELTTINDGGNEPMANMIQVGAVENGQEIRLDLQRRQWGTRERNTKTQSEQDKRHGSTV